MQPRLAALAVAAAGAAAAPFTDGIDWEAYLTRHDPIWRWGTNCTSGYTQHASTIGGSGAEGCAAVQCSSAASCVEEAASQCDACPGCAAFGLSPKWRAGALPQLYGPTTALNPNPDWTTWTKGGTALPNHTSCTTANLAIAWEDSAFFGNGLTGGLLRNDPVLWNTSLLLEVGRTDVWDRRAPGSRYATGGVMYDRPRLPVGWARLSVTGGGVITGGVTRVHLHNATISGTLNTTAGVVTFALYAHYTQLALLVAWNASAPGLGLGVAFFPDPGNTTRQNPPASYVPNPPPDCSEQPGGAPYVCTQTLLAGGNYATALLSTPGAPWAGAASSSGLSVLHIANDWPASTSPQTAAGVVTAVAASASSPAGWDALLAEHAAAWEAYWRTSWLSVPDTATEGTYVMQMYKYACAGRPDGPPIDLMGPGGSTAAGSCTGST